MAQTNEIRLQLFQFPRLKSFHLVLDGEQRHAAKDARVASVVKMARAERVLSWNAVAQEALGGRRQGSMPLCRQRQRSPEGFGVERDMPFVPGAATTPNLLDSR